MPCTGTNSMQSDLAEAKNALEIATVLRFAHMK